MAARKKLALFFTYNENWIGGTYYIVNLVNALNVLEDAKKPFITIIGHTKADYEYMLHETAYPYLSFVKNKSGNPFYAKLVNLFSQQLLKKKLIEQQLADEYDLLFPCAVNSHYLSLIDDKKKVSWIPDFQDFHLPELYSPQALVEVRTRNLSIAHLAQRIVLSSEDAAHDFKKQYPDATAEIRVIPFTVTHPSLEGLDFNAIKNKYKIHSAYFYVPNQYWAHKNHQLVIEAVQQLKEKNPSILVLFSGKEFDPRNPAYVPMLKAMVNDYGLNEHIKFLGFLDRKEQLLLMQHAKAIIQPSKFEGWSTVIEDAKALNKFVFASDLAVNKEQLHENVCFFDRTSANDLCEKLQQTNISFVSKDYASNKLVHAKSFISLLE